MSTSPLPRFLTPPPPPAEPRQAVFNPNNTTINQDTIGDWLRSAVSGDITEVPGIGPANAEKLATEGVQTTHQLIGKFLMLKQDPPVGEDVHPVAFHMNEMASWLQSIGVNASRGNIVLALAEKCDIFMPGIYDGSIYEEA